LIGIFVEERTKKNAVDDGEDGGGGADAESESEDRDRSEDGRFSEKAEREASILQESLDHRKTPGVTVGFFGLLRTAELHKGVTAGLFGAHAGAKIFFDGEVDMIGDFGAEVAVELVSAEEG
jgi:hypothetical protein